jgi:hypothetical protein
VRRGRPDLAPLCVKGPFPAFVSVPRLSPPSSKRRLTAVARRRRPEAAGTT